MDERSCPPWVFFVLASVALIVAPSQKLLVELRYEGIRVEAVTPLPFSEIVDDGVGDRQGLLLGLMIEDSPDGLQEQPVGNEGLAFPLKMAESAPRADQEQVGPFEGELLMIDEYQLLLPLESVANAAHGLVSAPEELEPLELPQQEREEGQIEACKTIYAHYIE